MLSATGNVWGTLVRAEGGRRVFGVRIVALQREPFLCGHGIPVRPAAAIDDEPGGTSSWHDLALHIVARHASPGEALRIAKVYLLKLHTEGQLPYRALVRGSPEADAAVRSAQAFLEARFRDDHALADAVAHVGVPERTLKRRFKAATGTTLIAYLQNLRIEQAKRSLASSSLPVEEVSVRGDGAVPPGRGQGCSWAVPRRLASIGAATARAPRSSRILVASAVPGRGRHGRR